MTVKEKFDEWLTGAKEDLKGNYIKLGLKASGNWGEELESKVSETSNGFKGILLGLPYTGIMVDGRTPNKDQSNLKAWVGWAGSTFLKDWVQQKGLSINPFAVAWKIGREGINVPNENNSGTLISDAITNDKISELTKSMADVMSVNLRSDLKNIL